MTIPPYLSRSAYSWSFVVPRDSVATEEGAEVVLSAPERLPSALPETLLSSSLFAICTSVAGSIVGGRDASVWVREAVKSGHAVLRSVVESNWTKLWLSFERSGPKLNLARTKSARRRKRRQERYLRGVDIAKEGVTKDGVEAGKVIRIEVEVLVGVVAEGDVLVRTVQWDLRLRNGGQVEWMHWEGIAAGRKTVSLQDTYRILQLLTQA